uniref:ABC1 atypical kinase-like domain-containing protein n=1 Tax=Opuntia streptacantha TaxID=393608 RepID=A0A7C9EKB4_OPUST
MLRCSLLEGLKIIGPGRNEAQWVLSIMVHKRFYSTGFSSVHGERPSAEYAKLRKQSLEDEFGHVLGTYSSRSFSAVYRFGPFLALFRAAVISYHVLKLSAWQLFVHDVKKRATKFCETLIRLGPFYIKLGQALSTRPDILPTIYCQELARLQDQIPPFPTSVAIRSIETQLGVPVSELFADISAEPIAAASLGQVYKAHLHSGEMVAVKVQRPGMSLSLTLDALLFHMIGGQLKRFAKARKDLLVAVNEMVRHMFEEIDYILEGENAERFASLYASYACDDNDKIDLSHQDRDSLLDKRHTLIKVPKIYWKYTRKAVLTMEWIKGIKLTDEEALAKAQLKRKELVDMGLYCSLRQLLEVGFFHADPHPGNLVATDDGSLAYFDFGMMGDIPRHYRVGLIRVLVHFVNRDSLGLANDFLSLGFIPEGLDIQLVSDALQASFGDGTRQSRDFQSIMNQLYDVMYDFNFSLPPDYALVIRALGSLEGTAKALDPDFKVIESAYPFVIGRLLADPSPDMRKILRELLIRNDGSIRWSRLERLIAAISEDASDSDGENADSAIGSSVPFRWKSFDMRSVVAATEDLLLFILSEKGLRVRQYLVRDILKAVDALLQEDLVACIFDGCSIEMNTSISEEHTMVTRMANGLQYFGQALRKAPDAWVAMLARLSVKPEFRAFILDVISALMQLSSRKIPEASWFFDARSDGAQL